MTQPSSRFPKLVVLAGPNGAGKTTASKALLQGALQVSEFANADSIAHGLSAFKPGRVAGTAGRIMLQRLDELAEAGEDFAFETTLASRSFRPRIQSLLERGYRFHLIFLHLPDPLQALERVAQRVAAGGHDVPRDTILRRYERGIRNFFQLFQELTDSWYIYDNSGELPPRLIAAGVGRVTEIIGDATLWSKVNSLYASKQ